MENRKALLAYLSVCFFWGSTFLAIRIAVKDTQPFILASIRFLVAGCVLVLYGLIKKMTFPKTKIEYLEIICSGILILTGGNGLVTYSEQWMHSGIASLMVTTIPLFMVFIEANILKAVKINWKGYMGFAISFTGVAILTLTGGEELSVDALGVTLLLMASICWASGSVFSKNIKTGADILPRIGIQMLGGSSGLFIMSRLTGESLSVQFSSNSLMALLYLIFFGSLVGYSSYFYVLDKWSASRVGTYAYVNPVVAVGLGALILREPVTELVILAMVVIISGVVIVQKRGIVKVDRSQPLGTKVT